LYTGVSDFVQHSCSAFFLVIVCTSSKVVIKKFIICMLFFQFFKCSFAAADNITDEISDSSKITRIEFEGNHLIDSSYILDVMDMKVGDVYSKELVQQNLRAIHKTGYFSEKMKAIPIPNDPESLTLRIYLEENIPITGFAVTGNTVVSTGEILSILNTLEGQPQNLKTLNDAIVNVEDLYASKGYVLARVSDFNDDPDGCVNITLEEGTINSIAFEGNKKTKDFVIERNILSSPGSVYNEDILKADLMRLYSTQAFKDVNRKIEKSDENPNAYDVTIVLEEQRTGTISLGGGLDTATGLFGQAGFVENNFLGNGQRVGINFMAGTGVIMSDSSTLDHANLQAEVSFFEPRLKGSDYSLLVKAFGRDFGSYQVPLAVEKRYGADVVLSRPVKNYKNLMASLKLGGEYIRVKEGDYNKISKIYNQHNIPISERSKQLQGGTYITLGPSLIYDTRDSMLNPRDGVLVTLRFNENINMTDLDFTHGTLSAGIKKYFPVMKKSSFSLMARAAGKLHGDMPEVMAYSLGGPYTVRGYRMSTIGTGEGFMLGSAELTTPFFFLDRIEKAKFLDNIKFSLFVDAGHLYNGTITNKLYNRPEYGIAGGLGVKLFIPGVGPLSIDYGIPFTNVGSGNKRGAFSFGVGDVF
ncbi:MAG: BamA/TamA family outer membrane protein, partial [Candidatus Gastranaerophilales bacterium]|nr:BamA/TamA family outer membrane protein [Candidatus Gastranaerophilales bacterium]